MVNAQADAMGRISTLGGPLRESVGTSSRVAGKPTDKAGDQHRPPSKPPACKSAGGFAFCVIQSIPEP